MPAETTIHTIRHAPTRFNAEKRYAGSIDVELSEEGIRQALAAASRLADLRVDVVVTSTLKRAIDTAHLLYGDRAKFVECELCNERRFGILEGCTWEDVPHLEPPVLLVQVGNDLHTVNPKNGEPFEDVWERAKRFRRWLFRRYRGLSVLVVSHGVFLQMFHGVLRGSNCIESLGSYPRSLEVASFAFCDDCLVNETVTKLAGEEYVRW